MNVEGGGAGDGLELVPRRVLRAPLMSILICMPTDELLPRGRWTNTYLNIKWWSPRSSPSGVGDVQWKERATDQRLERGGGDDGSGDEHAGAARRRRRGRHGQTDGQTKFFGGDFF